jgi:hypothetical protein
MCLLQGAVPASESSAGVGGLTDTAKRSLPARQINQVSVQPKQVWQCNSDLSFWQFFLDRPQAGSDSLIIGVKIAISDTVLRIRDPVLCYPLDPGWIFPDPGSGPFFGDIFLHYLQNFCCDLYETELPVLLKLTPETISSKKKVCLVLLPPFYIGLWIRDPDPGWKKLSDPESGIKHLGSVTLNRYYYYWYRYILKPRCILKLGTGTVTNVLRMKTL